ncbi:unnamed protein product, partial [marine sediment metagenome]
EAVAILMRSNKIEEIYDKFFQPYNGKIVNIIPIN